MGGALSEATAAALRVHVLAQLTAALAEEEEGIGEDDEDGEDEADEADWVNCEDADNDGDAGGDSAVQAMLDAFLADGGSFEETGGVEDGVGDGVEGGVGDGVGDGAASGGRGARTDRFSSVLAPRGEAEEARWDLRLELTPPVRSSRAQPSTLSLAPLPRFTTPHHTTPPPHHHHHTTTPPPHHHHTTTTTTPPHHHHPDQVRLRRTLGPIPHSPQVRDALHELMRGATGDVLEVSAGGGAPLFELAALVSAPGARAQPMHADTLWCEGGCLFSAFVALQPVRREMGPAHLPTPLTYRFPYLLTRAHSRIL